MNELLAIALEAHGGLDRWNKLKGWFVGMSISGLHWLSRDYETYSTTVASKCRSPSNTWLPIQSAKGEN